MTLDFGLWMAVGLLVVATLVSFVLALRISLKFNQIVKEIASALLAMDSGNSNIQFSPTNSKEVTRLFNIITVTAVKIAETAAQLQEKEELLQTLLNSLGEGLIVLDKTGKIIIASSSFKKLFNAKSPEGKFYWELIREPKLAESLRKENPQQSPFTIKMEAKGRTLLISFSPTTTGGQLVIFRDISEIVNVERMKRELLANLSHELRTPLAAIKGYVETMEETVDESNRYYLNVIKRHTERLISLVSDLLSLARLEDAAGKPTEENVNLKEVVANVAAIFKHLAEKKGLTLATVLPAEVPVLSGDPLQIEQALINLVDNAIKYTENGTVTITINTNPEEVAISVADTGIGIDNQHLPKIFERFYVVGRSRSRATGGTGLGLAIVKHIVNLHHGKIQVESTLGRGTKFTILLPTRA